MLKTKLEQIVSKALTELSAGDCRYLLSRTEDEKNGDYFTNAAMVCAKKTGISPMEFAEKLKDLVEKEDAKIIEKAETAAPGFLNLFISAETLADEAISLNASMDKPEPVLEKGKINLEFVSANPTGELHIGHARGAFFGDILGNVLSYAGAEVTREYFINDSRESNQIKELGKTAKGEGEQYKTELVSALAGEEDFSGKTAEEAGFLLAQKIQKHNQNFLEKSAGVRFDNWYSEDENIYQKGMATETLNKLKNIQRTYEKDNALWLKTSEYGDDEDRVLVRSNGSYTYFLSDIAYHGDKFGRGFEKVIDVWGADHHGHVKRMMAVKKMLGWPGELFIFVTQLVSLKEGGEAKKMSKRLGNVVLLKDLIEEFGLDVARWFFAEKSLNTHVEFDAELAREHSAKNPVYYVQYAHARTSSILEKAKDCVPKGEDSPARFVSNEPSAKKLAKAIAGFPEAIEDIAKNYQVHKLCSYAYHLAEEFSQFYRDVKVIDDGKFNPAALQLVSIAQKTLAKSLSLIGISAPEKM